MVPTVLVVRIVRWALLTPVVIRSLLLVARLQIVVRRKKRWIPLVNVPTVAGSTLSCGPARLFAIVMR